MDVQRIAAFSHRAAGGNPGGVVLCATLPAPDKMQAIAAEVEYFETAFAVPHGRCAFTPVISGLFKSH